MDTSAVIMYVSRHPVMRKQLLGQPIVLSVSVCLCLSVCGCTIGSSMRRGHVAAVSLGVHLYPWAKMYERRMLCARGPVLLNEASVVSC